MEGARRLCQGARADVRRAVADAGETAAGASVFGEVTRTDYRVAKVYFESLPGFFVTGNLYRPIGNGPFPAVLSPHGHWTYGRLENTPTTSGPARAIGLARQGFVVFSYDMIGYNDSQQLPHTFGGKAQHLWGLSLAGLQLWNGIRALDFLESLPDVRRDEIAATGESGGGSQTFLLAAVDPRVKVAVPVNMISLHMQGGCLCENPPGLRLDMTNVEIAATIAPRPMLMVSATGDWTAETMEVEYPAMRAVYDLFGAADRVQAVRITAEHNYNKDSREAMYAWMARWLQKAPADVKITERSFTVEPLQDLLVFHRRALPAQAVTAEQLTDAWIAAAKRAVERRSFSRDDDCVLACGWLRGHRWSCATKVQPHGPAGTLGSGSGEGAGQRWLHGEADCLHAFRRSARHRRSLTSIPTTARRRPSGLPTSFALRGTRPGPQSLPTATRRWRHCSRVRWFPSRLLFSMSDGSIRRAMRLISIVCTFLACAGPEICKPLWPSARGRSLFTTLATGLSCAGSTLNRE